MSSQRPISRILPLASLALFATACAPLKTQPEAPKPLSTGEWQDMASAALFGPEDQAALRMSLPLLEPRVEEILDVWYGFVGSQPELLATFANGKGVPQAEYLNAVRVRFGRWIVETARADYDAAWLAQAHEVGLRHHTSKKNRTDGADAAPVVPLRYLSPLTIPVVTTLRPFLEAGDHTKEQVDAMQQAWFKSVLLQTVLWSQPYAEAGTF